MTVFLQGVWICTSSSGWKVGLMVNDLQGFLPGEECGCGRISAVETRGPLLAAMDASSPGRNGYGKMCISPSFSSALWTRWFGIISVSSVWGRRGLTPGLESWLTILRGSLLTGVYGRICISPSNHERRRRREGQNITGHNWRSKSENTHQDGEGGQPGQSQRTIGREQ